MKDIFQKLGNYFSCQKVNGLLKKPVRLDLCAKIGFIDMYVMSVNLSVLPKKTQFFLLAIQKLYI